MQWTIYYCTSQNNTSVSVCVCVASRVELSSYTQTHTNWQMLGCGRCSILTSTGFQYLASWVESHITTEQNGLSTPTHADETPTQAHVHMYYKLYLFCNRQSIIVQAFLEFSHVQRLAPIIVHDAEKPLEGDGVRFVLAAILRTKNTCRVL